MSDNRPNPLQEAASAVSAIWASVSGILGLVAWFGILNATQVDAIRNLFQVLPGSLIALGAVISAALPILTAVLAAFHTAGKARPEVTPVAAPRNNAGVPLVPAHPGGHA